MQYPAYLLPAGERFEGQLAPPSSLGAPCPGWDGVSQPWRLSGCATRWMGQERVIDQGPKETKPKLGVGLVPHLWEVTRAPCSFSPLHVSLFSILILSIPLSCLTSYQPHWLCIETPGATVNVA